MPRHWYHTPNAAASRASSRAPRRRTRRGVQDGAGNKPPRPFVVRFDGAGWRVQQGVNWRHAREVSVLAPTITAPDGTLRGVGVGAPARDGVITITS